MPNLECKQTVVEFFLDNGANPNVINEQRNTPLHSAVILQDLENQYSKKLSNDELQALIPNRAKIIELLITYGAKINAKNSHSEPALDIIDHDENTKIYWKETDVYWRLMDAPND